MRLLPFFAGFLALFVGKALAQPAYVSPEVVSDGRVIFRLQAPNAREVAVKGLRHLPPQAMTKDAKGLWSVTVGPLAPDLYSYTFDVDGATFTDPVNRHMKEWLAEESLVEVPANPPLPLALQPVPHGTVHRHVISSVVRHGDVALEVYTPPGFDPKAATTYPVLYLLHGYGDGETAWLVAGHANFIADNLLAAGRVGPAIIVMTNGHPVPIPATGSPDYSSDNGAAMDDELLHVVLPFVEKNYPVRQAAADRAIAGLSMGGAQSLAIGLGHPELFGWVGGFSSGAPTQELGRRFASLLAAEQKNSGAPRLIWLGVGKEDFLLEPNLKFHLWLEEKKVPHEWRLTDGGHEWPVWRGYLEEFLRKIFRRARIAKHPALVGPALVAGPPGRRFQVEPDLRAGLLSC